MLIQTTLKNGYSFVTDCENLSTKTNSFTGSIVETQWSGCKTGKPIYVDASEVVAIVRLDDCTLTDCTEEAKQKV